MSFKVFLSYSLDPAEQALAWRLQTLAAAHGIEMYVPARESAVSPKVEGSSSVAIRNAIDRSDCVLAIITARANGKAQEELRYALAKGKLVIPIVHSDFAQIPLLAQFQRVFTFSPWDNPGKVEGEVVQFLKEQHLSKENRQRLGGIVALGVGLLLLFSLDADEPHALMRKLRDDLGFRASEPVLGEAIARAPEPM
jgi:nucleoside 2-deoxyribosyltransferase